MNGGRERERGGGGGGLGRATIPNGQMTCLLVTFPREGTKVTFDVRMEELDQHQNCLPQNHRLFVFPLVCFS